mgnify:CR=1 FL=1
MQSSLRGIIFNDESMAIGSKGGLESRRDTINLGSALGNNTTVLNDYNTKPKENTYTKMQNNLKSLQDKIKDLENKLTKVNDTEESATDVTVDQPATFRRNPQTAISSANPLLSSSKKKGILKHNKLEHSSTRDNLSNSRVSRQSSQKVLKRNHQSERYLNDNERSSSK